ncbi:hypothetical protein [Streptomyces sp. NPDC002537]
MADVDTSAAYVRPACHVSLRRASAPITSTSTFMHRRDPAVPIGETVGAMAALAEAGTTRLGH